MVLGDLIIFGSYFLIFMVHRTMAPQEFLEAQQHLNLNIGVLNTLVLLTSSWFVARSVVAARGGDYTAAVRLTYLGGACGALFIGLKAYEWWREATQGSRWAAPLPRSSSTSITCSPACTCSTCRWGC